MRVPGGLVVTLMPVSVVVASLAEMLPLIVRAAPLLTRAVCIEAIPAAPTMRVPLLEVRVTVPPVIRPVADVDNDRPVAVIAPVPVETVPRVTAPGVEVTINAPLFVVTVPLKVSLLAPFTVMAAPAPVVVSVVPVVWTKLFRFVVASV